jgi:predicted CopG family antitoxin
MDDQVKSKAERQIEQIMQEVEPGSDRYRALESAKRFKSSWAELGERLAEVRRKKLFENWGYAVFEDYCSREIRIRKATADKLLMAYHFLEKSEPQLLARREELSPIIGPSTCCGRPGRRKIFRMKNMPICARQSWMKSAATPPF